MSARLAAVIFVAALVLIAVPASAAQEHGEQAAAVQEHEAPAQEEHAEQAGHATDEHAAADEHAATDEHATEEHGAAAEHGGEHEGPSWAEYAYKWVNFALLLGLLYWLLVVPPAFVRENFEFEGLRPLLARRSQAIVEARRLAAEQRADAVRRDETSARRLADVNSEAQALVHTARDDGERERQRLAVEADAEAARIRQLAHRDMQSEVNRAARDLRAHTADVTVAMATDILRRSLSPEDQQRLIREYLQRLGTNLA